MYLQHVSAISYHQITKKIINCIQTYRQSDTSQILQISYVYRNKYTRKRKKNLIFFICIKD